MPGFLDFLREAFGTIANTPTAVAHGQASQNPLVAGLSSLAGVPFQALQMPGSVLSNYLEKFRAPGVENRLRSIQADQAQATLQTSPEGQAMQFNPTPGYTSAQGVPQRQKVPFAQLPPAHKARLRMLADRMGLPSDDATLERAWEGASQLPSNLPPPVLTKEGATIRNLESETAKNAAAAAGIQGGTVPPYPGMIPLTVKDGKVTWGLPPAPVGVPGQSPADAPAISPGAPPPKPPAQIGKTGPSARAGQPFTYTDQQTGQVVKGTFGKDGMQATADDGSKWVFDEQKQALLPVPAQQLPAGEAGSAAAPSPAPTEPDPNAPGANAQDDEPAVQGPPPAAPAPATPAAPSAAPAPAPAPAPPAPAPAAPVIPPPPAVPGAAPAPVVPATPAPGGLPPAAAPTPAPAAPAPAVDPNAARLDALEEQLEPGASQRPPPGATGFPSAAPAEMATGTSAGALLGQQLGPTPLAPAPAPAGPQVGFPSGAPEEMQLAQADQPRTLPGEFGGVPQPPGTTPRGRAGAGEIVKPPTFSGTWADRYRIAMDKSEELYKYVTDRGFKTLGDARKDHHVNGLMHTWWANEDIRVKAAQQLAATQGKANAAVQRQLGSIMAMENSLDFIEKDLGGKPKTSGLDVPVSLEWSNASDYLNKLRDEIPILGPMGQEAFSASGVGPPWTSPRWYTVRQMSKDPSHPWFQQSGRLMTMEGTAGLGVRSLGDVGTMTDREKEIFANAYLPQAQDTPELRRHKVRIVRELLHGIKDGMLRGTLTTPEKVREHMRNNAQNGMVFEPGPGTGPTPEEREPESRAPRTLERQPKAVARRLTGRKVA